MITTSKQIHILDCDINELKFNENIKCLNFKSKLPILCDSNFNVLFGNYFKRNKLCKVIKIEVSNLLREGLLLLEQALTTENKIERLYQLDQELNAYLKNETDDFEQISLFELDEIIDKRTITKELYIYPGEYDFKKHRKEKVSEDDDYSLFESEEFIYEDVSC